MRAMTMNAKIISGGVAAFVLLLAGSWYFFSGSETPQNPQAQNFGSADTRTNVSSGGEEVPQNEPSTTESVNQKVFKIHNGPIAGATFVQTFNPTTTIARFVLAENGRVFDVAVDSPGAVPRTISNTTIPGIARALWAGSNAVLQYLDQDTLKTLALALPAATTSSATTQTRLQFLPNNMVDVAISPDGAQIAYLLETSTGADGYIARSDGAGARKAFSVPLSQLLLTWPSVGTLIAQAPPAFGVETVAFSINAVNGTVSPFLHAAGLSLTGDRSFTRVIYHSAGGAAGRVTYSHNMRTGLDTTLSFDPLPEQCIWSRLASSTAYCAAAAIFTPDNFADLRRTGEMSAPQQIVRYNESNYASIVAVPGTADGGVSSDIAEMALSLDERYLLFIRKGDRSLWGVRLAQ